MDDHNDPAFSPLTGPEHEVDPELAVAALADPELRFARPRACPRNADVAARAVVVGCGGRRDGERHREGERQEET